LTSAPEYTPLVGVVDDPSACVPPAPEDVASFLAAMRTALADRSPPPVPTPELMERFNAWVMERRRLDYADLCRYAAANASLPAPDDKRVVFIGDSITEAWPLYGPKAFAAWINRGISGQTTPQILGRFRADALALAPRAIHLMAGVNDIAGNTGPTTLEWIEGNIRSMSELARASGIQIILGSLTPAARFAWRPDIECRDHVASVNAWMQGYAGDVGATYVDYFTALSDGVGGLRAEFTSDGVHPNADGYAVMTPLAREAVRKALGG
jgi:lysophospholipase L1-like esterase